MHKLIVIALMFLSVVSFSAEESEEQPADVQCTASMWCAPWEHCLGGRCVNKDVFNKCWNDFDCVFPDRCVSGVCGG